MTETISPLDTLRALVALPGPPGQEGAVRAYVADRLSALGIAYRTDARGNLLAATTATFPEKPSVVVTAHLDEIALLVSGIEHDSSLRVRALGGLFPWKWGEGPVDILARDGATVPGIVSFGSIHTTSPHSVAEQARSGVALTWDAARVVTGLSIAALDNTGIRPGSRVVMARSRRTVTELGGGLLASYFFDDRADILAWLLALEKLRGREDMKNILFAATTAEEVGGEGAQYLLNSLQPDVCVALEIGPSTPDAPVPLDAHPTVWVTDSYSTMAPEDLDLLDAVGRDLKLDIHWQALTRGGSDASCAASRGLCARPVTLAFAAENSHGFEIMHRDAPVNLARLLVGYLDRLNASAESR